MGFSQKAIDTKMNRQIGRKFDRLIVIGVGKSHTTKSGYLTRYLLCRCSCGVEKEIRTSDLTSGKTTSCGCKSQENKLKLKNDLVGQKFGKLTVVKRNTDRKDWKAIFYDVLCECGEVNIVSYPNLVNGVTNSCGHCGLYRNGIATSWSALKLNEMIPNGLHNYYTGILWNHHNINVDIALIEEKIAIEYDGLYWHKNKTETDKQQTELLIKAGWKVLRISANRALPTQQQLDSYLTILQTPGIQSLLVTLDE